MIAPSMIAQSVYRFGRDVRGIAAVEFGLIVPFLLVLFLGAVEYSRATMYAKRFNLVTAMTSDLVAREYLLSTADLGGIRRAVQTVWSGYDNEATLQIEVLHVRRAGDLSTKKTPGSTYVEWSYDLMTGTPTRPACQDYALPVADMIQRGNAIVVVNGRYTYPNLLGRSAPGMTATTLDWATRSMHAPRDLCVAYNRTNCLTTCE